MKDQVDKCTACSIKAIAVTNEEESKQHGHVTVHAMASLPHSIVASSSIAVCQNLFFHPHTIKRAWVRMF